MDMVKRFAQLIMAQVFLSVVVTQEEDRALEALRAALRLAESPSGAEWKIICWDCGSGWDDEPQDPGSIMLPSASARSIASRPGWTAARPSTF
jgi:hypothetical protein